jgi:hypothetical protein
MLDLFGMSDAQLDRAVEAHWDRVWERMNAPDAWDHDDPDWQDIADLVDGKSPAAIAEIVRDYIEANPDMMTEAAGAGVLDDYIHPEDRWMLKDPDDAWRLVDGILDREWSDDGLFMDVYKWMPETHLQAMIERLMRDADSNGIREDYNDSRREI